jgi:hypothetical protein
MNENYIVITLASESYDHHVEILDAAELEKRITPDPGGRDTYYGGYGLRFVKTLKELDEARLPHGAPCPILIFKAGEPIIPKPVAIATHYDLE